MKKIEAIIKPFNLDAVKDGLSAMGIDGMTVIEASEHVRQPRRTEIFRGSQYTVDLIPKIKIEIVVADHLVEPAVAVILEAAKNGTNAEGKVFLSTIAESFSIRSEAKGKLAAVSAA
jgi:nitrogen regulatory protein P-II 1